jgi:glutamate-1-semialdehyde 2,1-aminomutase
MGGAGTTRRNDTGLDKPGSLSATAFQRARPVIPGGSARPSSWFAPHPPYALSGAGCWITDLDGQRILDCSNNFFSLVHGHAFPPVVEAIREAALSGTAFGLPTLHEIELAEAITRRAPHLEQVRFCNSGTEAVMFAVKGARAITGRSAIAKFEGAYHGTYDVLEVSYDSVPEDWDGPDGDPAPVPYVRGTPPGLLAETVILPFGDPERCADILRRKGRTLAAIVFDPMASRVGMIPSTAALVAVLQEACARDGILLICDEVIGFRMSYSGAHSLFGLKPDLVALGKVIGGGLPAGGVAGPVERMAIYDHTHGRPGVALGGTFSANPLTMVAGSATLAAFDAAAVTRLNTLGDNFRRDTNAAFATAGLPAQLTGKGALFRLHLTTEALRDYRSITPVPGGKRALAAVHAGVLARGALLTPNCSGAFSTPMTAAETGMLRSLLLEAVAEVMA